MKGVIALALKGMMVDKYGEDKWKSALSKAGIEKEPVILPTSDVSDELVLKVVQAVCETLGISLQQAADAFGDYWVNVYSQQMYKVYFEGVTTAKDFLLKMDTVHVGTTKNLPDASPPRFEYEWKDDKTLIMHYKSKRNLIDFMVGLIKGVGIYYKEDLKVRKLDNNQIEVVFP
jgi:hypothetical protein